MKKFQKKYSAVIKWYRFERWLYCHKLRHIAILVYHLIQLIFGCTIPPSVVLEKGVDIPHFHGIVIHQDTYVGQGTVIYQNVTIGGRNGECAIIIGKNCIISAGACILGKIVVGDNVKIGANAVVLNDIPDNSMAVGIPARIIRH